MTCSAVADHRSNEAACDVSQLAERANEYIANAAELGHDPSMHNLSIAMWVAIGAGVFGLAMTLLMLKRSSGPMDLGSVSEQWMAQHRAGRADDPQH